MRELGERLRGFRLRHGWSKRSVARRLGVSTPSIIRWEEGTAEPNDYNLYKIEQLLASRTASTATAGTRASATATREPNANAADGGAS